MAKGIYSNFKHLDIFLKPLALLDTYIVFLFELALRNFFLQIVYRLQQSSNLLRVHLIECLDLLLTACVALLKLVIFSLKDEVFCLGQIVVLLKQVYQLVLRLVFAKLHLLLSH